MRKVLLIVKNEDLCLALQNALQNTYEVIIYSNAVDGADLLHLRPDALILDLLLPGIDGLTFLKNNWDKRPPIALMLTTFFSPDILQRIDDLGVNYAFRIPCSISAVMAKLDELLN